VTEKFFSIRPVGSQLRPGQKVLKSADYEQMVSYEQLLQELQDHYHKREEGLEAALAQSIRHGTEQGLEHANQQHAQQMLAFMDATGRHLAKLERGLAGVVMTAVRKVLYSFDNEELVKQAVLNGLELVRGSHKLLVRVNPQVQAAVAARLERVDHRFVSLDVVGDSLLRHDECILESDLGIINAGITQQMEVIERTLGSVFPAT